MRFADKKVLDLGDVNNTVRVIRRGLFRYAAVQRNGIIIASGIGLRRYYRESGRGPHGRLKVNVLHHCDPINQIIVPGTASIFLQFKNPKTNKFETIYTWK